MITFALPPKALAEALTELDSLAQRYTCRPSNLLGEDDPEWAYQIDMAARQAGIAAERKYRESRPPAPPAGPPPKMIRTVNGPLVVGTLRMENAA